MERSVRGRRRARPEPPEQHDSLASLAPDAPGHTDSPTPDPPAYSDSLKDVSRRVLELVFGPVRQRTFGVEYWDGTLERPTHRTGREFDLLLRHPGALRSMLLPPTDRSVGEAYVRGDFDIIGDLEAAVRAGWLRLGRLRELASLGRLLVLLRRLPRGDDAGNGRRDRSREGDLRAFGHPLGSRTRSPERDRLAVRFHYDLGNHFFSLFLDPRMQYSCAYFPTPDTPLDDAQREKLDLICRKLRLRPGERLLDIGCGWGGLLVHAARHYGVDATGITLSEAQANWARRWIREEGLEGRCRVRILDYRDLGTEKPFDKIASVGMIEHVGFARYPAYFQAAFRALRPGGLFLNHGIVSLKRGHTTRDRIRNLAERRLGSFFHRYIFPEADLVPLARTLVQAERAGFEIRDVESLREHYARTLGIWVKRLEEHWEEGAAEVGEATCRAWRFYMGASAHLFAAGYTGIVQSLLVRQGEGGDVRLPATRRDLLATRDEDDGEGEMEERSSAA